MKYKKILIIGGAGFVGSNLAVRYKQDYSGTEVIALDNLKRRGSELNITRLKEKGIKFIHGDIRNYEDFDSVGEAGLVIECSAECSVLAGYHNSPKYVIDFSKINKLTGWFPKIDVRKIVEDITEWILENKEALEKIFQ